MNNVINKTMDMASPEMPDFSEIRDHVVKTFSRMSEERGTPVLTVARTKASGLFTKYLSGFEEGPVRQSFNCSCCRDFLNRIGTLVYVNKDGSLTSAVWNETGAPADWADIIKEQRLAVESRPVRGTYNFLEADVNTHIIGYPEKGDRSDGQGKWTHFYLEATADDFLTKKLAPRTVYPAMVQDFIRQLGQVNVGTLRKIKLLASDGTLTYGEQYIAWVDYLLAAFTGLAEARKSTHGRNLMWECAVNASPGWLGFRSSALGILLEGECDMNSIRLFNEATKPINHRRPVAAPTQRQVEEATKKFMALGLQDSVRRRHATVEEILEVAEWKPTPLPEAKKPEGLFGAVKTKDGAAVSGNDDVLTSDRIQKVSLKTFKESVLPGANRVTVDWRILRHLSVGGWATAVVPEAKSIFKESSLHAGLYTTWSYQQAGVGYRMKSEGDVELIGMFHGRAIWSSLELQPLPASCIFPADLIPELYEHQRVVESFSNETPMEGDASQAAVATNWILDAPIKVLKDNVIMTYKIVSEE